MLAVVEATQVRYAASPLVKPVNWYSLHLHKKGYITYKLHSFLVTRLLYNEQAETVG